MPKVSVVIPCYNLGQYLNEAIHSVLNQTFRDFEIIVVNDGSTDIETIKVLNSITNPLIKIIHTNNQGLANARNNGISQAIGKFILPLDADDKIANTYLEKAVNILEESPEIGIVYCQAKILNGEISSWDLPEYQLPRILLDNLIFCSAFFLREDWELVGGYKPSMKYGWEDYEFWLSIIDLGKRVYRLPEFLFYYRKRSDSMANEMSREQVFYSYKEIVRNHQKLYINNIDAIFEHIYSLRDKVALQEHEKITKDTKIHNLNLEVITLKNDISRLTSKKALLRLLFNETLKYFKLSK